MPARAWLAFAALGVIWGVPYFFIKLAVAELSPFFVAWSRIALAALLLVPLAARSGSLRATLPHKGAILAFALIEFVVPFSAISIGEQWIDSSVTGMLIALVPISILVVSPFFGIQERPGFVRLAGLLLGLAGVMSLLGFGTVSGPLGWAGVGCMLLATLGYSIAPLIAQRRFGDLDALGPAAASLLVASVVLLPPALLTLPRAWPSPTALVSIAVLGVVCTAAAMVLMFFLIRSGGAARASLITYVNPAVATLLGVAVLGEPLGPGAIAGFALILLGSWLASRPPALARGRAKAAVE